MRKFSLLLATQFSLIDKRI